MVSKLRTGCAQLRDRPLWINDSPNASVVDIRAEARKLQRGIESKRAGIPVARLGLVVVDYLQLMSGQREHGWSREQEISGISRGLKQLAKELGVPVAALSQLNRETERRGRSRKPQLSDLRESGAIEQDSDTVIFLYRESYYEDNADPDLAEVIIAKQRNGPTGNVNVRFNAARMRYENLAPKEYEFDDLDQFDENEDLE
jgi:replicative DNA helicase